jgi:sortase (surface protein transpeptidase)
MSRACVGLTVALALIAGACGQSGHTASAHKAKPAVHAAPTSTPQRQLPAQLVIPKISVMAPVEQVGVDRNNNMDVPTKASDVAWYRPGPAPGEAGDAVIDGHLDWTTGKAVFWDLHLLQAGDEIDVVSQDGVKLRFTVTDAHSYSYTAHPAGLFATSGQPQLSLITCSGSWDKGRQVYLQRLVVNASYTGTA